jgi:hypothetical protein
VSLVSCWTSAVLATKSWLAEMNSILSVCMNLSGQQRITDCTRHLGCRW